MMRIRIDFDSASTEQVRQLCAALHETGLERATIGLNGPECWAGTTPNMYPNEFAEVVSRLVKADGAPILAMWKEKKGF